MTIFDLFDDVGEAFLIVFFSSDEVDVSGCIFLVVVFVFDLQRSDDSAIREATSSYLFQIVDFLCTSKNNHRILTKDDENVVHFVAE